MSVWIINNQCFNDDGGEATSTAIDIPGSQIRTGSDIILHARLLLSEQDGVPVALVGAKWVCQNITQASAVIPITPTSQYIRSVPTANLIDGTDTTQRIGVASFITPNGWVSNTGGAVPNLNFSANQECEALLSFEVVGTDVVQWDDLAIFIDVVTVGSPLGVTVLDINPPRPPAIRRVLVGR